MAKKQENRSIGSKKASRPAKASSPRKLIKKGKKGDAELTEGDSGGQDYEKTRLPDF